MVRQLTAIMFTYMAGYTSLMQEDEHLARVSRDRQQAVLDDSIGKRGGEVLQYFGDGTLSVFRSAIEAVSCAIEIQETLGWAHALAGDYEQAAQAFERLPELAGSEFAGASPRGFAYAKLGRIDDALRMRALLEVRSQSQPDVNLVMDFALIHEGLGERTEAIDRLNEAVGQRFGSMIFFHSFPPWQDARSYPRFQAILERVGLLQPAAA
jgi:tetratricopeptide (TPR) repeat protein